MNILLSAKAVRGIWGAAVGAKRKDTDQRVEDVLFCRGL